jgi:hypothetical protein
MDVIEQILELQKQLEHFTPRERERIRTIVTYTHKCEKFHVQQCCGQSLCKACYADHVRTSHPTAKYFLQKITPGTLITAKFNEPEEEILRSPEIQATSKGRIKCCAKFRSQNRHQRHCEIHHPKKTQEEILKYKEARNALRVSSRKDNSKGEKIDPIKLLSQEQVQSLIREIQKLQRLGAQDE